ncbi:MAG: hypothetical protein GWP05_05260 [Anaerolineaceae bacterium]|nr:hypothetical protein [Anaerolineaceae bacterium]
MSKEVLRKIGGHCWHVAPEWADVLFPPSGGGLVDALASGGGCEAKVAPGRRITRIELGGRGLYVKQYSGLRRLRRLARREWKVARWAHQAGLPTPEPVAACWRGGAIYVTAESPGARPLGDLVYKEHFEPADDEPPYPGHRPPEMVRLHRRRRRPGQVGRDVPGPRAIAAMIARLLAELHTLGLRHTDLHPGNLLVVGLGDPGDQAGPGGLGGSGGLGGLGGRWRLEVLDLVALEEMPGLRTLGEHLVQLNHFFEPLATRSERRRVLKFLEARGLRVEGGPRQIEADTQIYRRRFYRRRDGRCLRRGKYFRPLKVGRFSGFVVADWAQRLPRSADELARALEISEYVKKSRRGLSGFARVAGHRVFIKRDSQRGWRRPRGPWPKILEDWIRGSRQRKAWRMGHALGVRGIATARPLVWVDLCHGLRGRESIIVNEAITNYRPLDQVLGHLAGRKRASCIETVAREIRRLHESGLSHRDLKAQNVMVRFDGRLWRMVLVDMDGVRRHRGPLSRRRRRQDLMRLAFSWDWGYGVEDTVPDLAPSDCLRFLKTYLGPQVRQAITLSCRSGAAAEQSHLVRSWWRAVRSAMDRKAAGKR